MKKLYTLAIMFLFIITLAPTIAEASWWNPFTWFTPKTKQNPVVKNDIPLYITDKGTLRFSENIESTSTPEDIKKPVEKRKGGIFEEILKQESKPEINRAVKTETVVDTVYEIPKKEELIVNYQSHDQEIYQLINSTIENINVFEDGITSANSFLSTLRTTLNKYPSEQSIQQSGQDLINETNTMISLSRKLISIEQERSSKLHSYLGKGVSPKTNEINEIVQRYNTYYGQYKSSISKVSSLMTTVVLDEKRILNRLITETKTTISSYNNPVSRPAPVQDPYNQELESALSELQSILSNIQNSPVAMSVIEGRKRRAVDSWKSQNPDVYSSQTYSNKLRSILSSYGM